MPNLVSDKTVVKIRLFDGDISRLRRFYPRIHWSRVIRALVKAHLDELDRRLDKKLPKLPNPGER